MTIKTAFLGLMAIGGLMLAAGSAGAQVPPVDNGETPPAGDQPVVILAEVTDFDEFGIPVATVQLEVATLVLAIDNAAAMCDIPVESLNDQLDEEGNASCVVPTETEAGAAATDEATMVAVQLADSTIAVPIDLVADLCDTDSNLLSEELAAGDVVCVAASATIIPPVTTTTEGDTTTTTEGTVTTTGAAMP